MSDIQMITPKKTKADIMNILNSYSFSDEEINRLKYIYTKEWEAYKKGVSTFLENQGEEILNIEGMSLMLSKITSNKPDSDYEYKEKLFSEEKRSIFCQWLFKSHIMALENCDRKIGNHIDHHLPIILHLYLNESRAKRLQDPNLDMQFKIDDYNKLSDLIINKINEHLGEFYEIDIMEPITTEGPFDHIVANLKMVTIYQQSEDTYIKTFLNSLMNKINETSSIESFTRSEELFGLFGKKKNNERQMKIVKCLENVDIMGDINNFLNKLKNSKQFKYFNLYEYLRIQKFDFKYFGNNDDILSLIAYEYLKTKQTSLSLSFLFDSMPIYDFKKDMINIETDDEDSLKQHIYNDNFINKIKESIIKNCKSTDMKYLSFDKLVRCYSNPDDSYESTNGKLEISVEIEFKLDISKYINCIN